MNTHYIFDIDNTLTPSRQPIAKEFKTFFEDFCISNNVSLVTGSDYEKIEEQLGASILNKTYYIFACSGNTVYEDKKLISTNSLELPNEVVSWLLEQVAKSGFSLKTGRHIEYRPGSVNFSVVGRNANQTERNAYIKWDREHKERDWLVSIFNMRFPKFEALKGGETGIDICNKGQNKSQILKWFDSQDYIKFFGDAIYPGGNDYPLAVAIKNGVHFSVRNWEDTYEILSYLSDLK